MKVIIVGGGNVGYIAAETICDIHDVLVIEKDDQTAESVKSRLNVSVLHEDGTNPKNLEYALEEHGAEIIISTLDDDASNLFICMYAKSLSPEIKTIASINNPDYMIEKSAGVDVLISPEVITAKKMYRLATLENAVDFEEIESLGLCIAIFAVEKWHDIVGKIVMDIDSSAGFSIFGVYRDDSLILEVDSLEVHPGDRVCVIGTPDGLEAFNAIVGIEEETREFTILGGSVLGMILARLLVEDPVRRYVKILEKNHDKCVELSKNLNGVSIVNADYTEPEVQTQENVFKSDCTISTSHQDDTNLLMCMSAQKFNARKIVSRYFKKEYQDIFTFTGLESIIGYHKIVSNEITKCTVSDEMAIIRLKNHNELFFKHTVSSGSKLLDVRNGDIRMPPGIRIVALRREGQLSFPRLDIRFQEGDEVIVFTNVTKESELFKVFGKNLSE
ncbi:MAG: NAD-binding protein [Candidatus Methanomethylophilaceae archaeon]|nr:potassium transporter [Thermoplasmata archaeon]MBQ3684963.1 NAD-binding protein [Candidatus Methanomethylophilaceae archaeon]